MYATEHPKLPIADGWLESLRYTLIFTLYLRPGHDEQLPGRSYGSWFCTHPKHKNYVFIVTIYYVKSLYQL